MNLTTVASLAAPEKYDARILKEWAAEHFAISIGLLRECPYHGEPYKASDGESTHRKASAVNIADLRHPALRPFHGNTRELLAAARRITREYGNACALCAAFEQDDLD
jgi:hypothetical protein